MSILKTGFIDIIMLCETCCAVVSVWCLALFVYVTECYYGYRCALTNVHVCSVTVNVFIYSKLNLVIYLMA